MRSLKTIALAVVCALGIVTLAGAAIQTQNVLGAVAFWDTAADPYPSLVINGNTGIVSSGDGSAAATAAITFGASGAVTFNVEPTLSTGGTLGDVVITQAYGASAADHENAAFFIVDKSYTVSAVDVVWAVAETTGAMDVMVQRLQGTEACGAGDDLLAAVVDATATANTVTSPALTATGALLNLSDGERLCVELTATPNEIEGLVVSVKLGLR
jgi:hypothetical protein